MSDPAVTLSARPHQAGNRKPQPYNDQERRDGPLTKLIEEIGKAASAGWSQTARLVILLSAAAMAIALIIVATR